MFAIDAVSVHGLVITDASPPALDTHYLGNDQIPCLCHVGAAHKGLMMINDGSTKSCWR